MLSGRIERDVPQNLAEEILQSSGGSDGHENRRRVPFCLLDALP